MSHKLVESILDKDFVLAEAHFNDMLNDIMEKKLYEKKRMIAAEMNEAMGGLSKAEIEMRRKAGYKKASEVLGDPSQHKLKPLVNIKQLKKKVSETVEVNPDPEGRVRGGQTRPTKGTFRRKAAAAVIKTSRRVGDIAGDIAVSASRAKSAFNQFKQQRDQIKSQQTKQTKRKTAVTKDTKNKPGFMKRNINTFMGKEPGYVDKRTPEQKDKQKGGLGGKIARGVVRGIASDVLAAARP